jgi:glutaredoxin
MKTAGYCRWATLATLALLVLPPSLAGAQAIYRIVGPDGRVTFSDRPPVGSEKATPLGSGGRAPTGDGAVELPFELRQLMSRYPVTLYTGDGCEPCGAGRNLLNARGVPYTEMTVNTPQDAEALRKLTGEQSLPVLTIGGQQIKGFASTEWDEYLNAAGYPRTSRLPSGYRNPRPAPLVPLPEAPANGAKPPAPAQQSLPPPPPPPGPSPSNPAGIVF